jgi:hypothetical protein
MKNGYIAAILDLDTAEDLAVHAEHSTVHCSHITLAYKPSDETFAKYQHLIGKRVNVLIRDIYCDDHGQAAVVEGVPSENKVPHITISCAEGVPPGYSNRLLQQINCERKPFAMYGEAAVRFVQHQGTKGA